MTAVTIRTGHVCRGRVLHFNTEGPKGLKGRKAADPPCKPSGGRRPGRGCVGTNLHNGTGHRQRLRPDPDGLFIPGMSEHMVMDPTLRPAIRPGADLTDGMSTPEPGRLYPPLVDMLGNIRDGIGQLQVRDARIPPPYRRKRGNALVSGFGQFDLELP